LKGKVKPLTFTIVTVLLISIFAALFSPTVKAQGEIPRDQVVIVSNDWGPPSGFNPLQSAAPAWGTNIMYPSLYLYSPYTNEWIPYLASSYTWFDRYTMLVAIRDEATWWDGQPITADDVVYSLGLGKKYIISQYTPLWTYIANITAVDDKTVAFTANGTNLNYFQVISVLWNTLILPKHRWEALEAQYNTSITTDFRDDNPADIVGGGPYKLMTVTTESFTFVRVDNWWGEDAFGLPNPRYILHRNFIDNTAGAIAFDAGDVDVGTHFESAIWELWTVRGLARGTYYNTQPYFVGGSSVNLYMNYLKKGLNNTVVRRAIAYAMPVADMINGPYNNYSVPASPVPIIHTGPAATYINQTLINQYGWTYNITQAKKILDDAGIKDTDGDGTRELNGVELSGYTIQVPQGWSDWMGICVQIVDKMSEIGIGVTAEFPDFSVWWQRLTDKQLDLCLGWSGGNPGFDHPWNSFRTIMDPRLSFSAGNWGNYNNTAVEPLIDSIPAETDIAVLRNTYSKLEEIWLKDVVAVPLFYGAIWYEYSEDYWVGWPNSQNGFWFSNFYAGIPGSTSFPSQLPVFFTLVPKGQTPVQPSWVTSTKISTDQIYGDLAAAPIPEMPSFLILPLLMMLSLFAVAVYRRKE
jgi:peptide/nickel transport system substrate-binding protein